MNDTYEQCVKCKKYFLKEAFSFLNIFDNLGKVCDKCSTKLLKDKKE